MKNNLMSFLSQRFAVLTMMVERVCIKEQKAASIWSDLFEADFWDTILDFGMLRGSKEGNTDFAYVWSHTHTHTHTNVLSHFRCGNFHVFPLMGKCPCPPKNTSTRYVVTRDNNVTTLTM